jgi:hypothetical protein
MRRLAMLGLVLLTFGLAGCTGDQAPSPPVAAAGPQTAALGWSERADDSDKTLIFGVDELRVTDGGWAADVSIANHTDTRFEIPAASDSSERAFGLMLFGDGTTETLDDLVQRGTPPALRGAHVTQPPTPGVLTPGATWRGTISAPGALAVGAWVRVSFGPLTAVDDPPDGIPKDTFTWITDHAYELR